MMLNLLFLQAVSQGVVLQDSKISTHFIHIWQLGLIDTHVGHGGLSALGTRRPWCMSTMQALVHAHHAGVRAREEVYFLNHPSLYTSTIRLCCSQWNKEGGVWLLITPGVWILYMLPK